MSAKVERPATFFALASINYFGNCSGHGDDPRPNRLPGAQGRSPGRPRVRESSLRTHDS